MFSFSQTDVKQVKKVGVAGEDMQQEVEIKVTVAQLPTTQAIDNMIQSGQVQTSVNGITIQNGLTTSLISAKAATGTEKKYIARFVFVYRKEIITLYFSQAKRFRNRS